MLITIAIKAKISKYLQTRISHQYHLQIKCDKAASTVSTWSVIKHTCCRAVTCLEDGRPLRRQTTRAAMANDVSAEPQPPNRLRSAETNQHTPVYGNAAREQLAKIKQKLYTHLFVKLCIPLHEAP